MFPENGLENGPYGDKDPHSPFCVLTVRMIRYICTSTEKVSINHVIAANNVALPLQRVFCKVITVPP